MKTRRTMKRSSCWISACVFLAALCATDTYASVAVAGRPPPCLRDSAGRCVACQDGFYQQGAAQGCVACGCHPAGSLGPACDSRGRCSCRDGVSGPKCDRCPLGPITDSGCPRRLSGSSSQTSSCFCFGHSLQCSPQGGFSQHNISSSFSTGAEDWTTSSSQGAPPPDVHYRWSSRHQDLEVISRSSLPVYLSAPASFLTNQLFSYGQNFSFSLRLDRGVRHPSTSDVILEGGGLRVSAPLGALRSIVPCGQKIRYSFRLDEHPSSGWRPKLSSFQFQKLLQNLTAIKIRVTFGENGRGYLDNVLLQSAQPGPGVPAPWVQTCRCPPGYEGPQCERCSAGFRRSVPAEGAFSACEACHPHTGDCYAADQTRADPRCDCDPWGAESPHCDQLGRCSCRPGFEGLRCQWSTCPACFSSVRTKVEVFSARLRSLESLVWDMDGGLKPASRAELEAGLRAAEELVDELQTNTELVSGLERSLQSRLSSLSRSQLSEEQHLLQVSDSSSTIGQQVQTYRSRVEQLQDLMEQMRRSLDEARADLRSAEVPAGDAPQDTSPLSALVPIATGLADRHQAEAEAVERGSSEALSLSQKSLNQVKTLMNKENRVKELIGELKTMMRQSSAQLDGLEQQAALLSSEAKDESDMATSVLKDLDDLERGLPSPLKEDVDAMLTRLKGLDVATDGNISGVQELQSSVQRDMAATQDLLLQGRAAQKVLSSLQQRVDSAKETTDEALQKISSNMEQLDQALSSLRGFDQQVDSSRSLAEASIERLPSINSTIQQAVRDNQETLTALGDVSTDYDRALENINVLENMVHSLEGSLQALPPPSVLLSSSSSLSRDVQDLRTQTDAAAADVDAELDTAWRLETDGQQAVEDTAAALNNARETGAAVTAALRGIGDLLDRMGGPGSVDEQQLQQLEDSVASARRDLEDHLRPRLRDAEDQEDAQRRRLTNINLDIDSILKDISNLEDILRSIPSGCYNSPPIEQP